MSTQRKSVIAVAVSLVVIFGSVTGIGLYMRHTTRAARERREANERRAEEVLRLVYAAEKRLANERECYDSLDGLIKRGYVKGDRSPEGIVPSGYTLYLLTPSCNAFRLYALPNTDAGPGRTGDHIYSVTDTGRLIRLSIGTAEVLNVEKL